MHDPNPENVVKPEANCGSASIDQCNDSKCIGYKIMHQFCLLFIFSLQTEENHRASGELELCNLCTWAVMSSGIESTPLPPHLALPGGEESSGPFLRGAVGGRDEAEPGVLGQPVRSQ